MKKIFAFALGLLTVLTLSACSKQVYPETTPVAGSNEFTGILEEKKDFMIIVESQDGKDAYIFNLPESGMEISSSAGDKVTVTYTGDIQDIDAQLQAVEVRPAE